MSCEIVHVTGEAASGMSQFATNWPTSRHDRTSINSKNGTCTGQHTAFFTRSASIAKLTNGHESLCLFVQAFWREISPGQAISWKVSKLVLTGRFSIRAKISYKRVHTFFALLFYDRACRLPVGHGAARSGKNRTESSSGIPHPYAMWARKDALPVNTKVSTGIFCVEEKAKARQLQRFIPLANKQSKLLRKLISKTEGDRELD